MKHFYGLFYLVTIIILIVSLLSNNKQININTDNNPKQKYIIKYNTNKENNFNKLGPPFAPPLPKYYWPPSM